MRILVLEDSPAMRRLISAVLSEDGHTVAESEDGAISYDKRTIKNIDLMIADINMPRVNGIEAILAARHINSELKIIAISGGGTNDSDDYLNACKDLGAAEILKKPFEPAALVAMVRSLDADVQMDKQIA